MEKKAVSWLEVSEQPTGTKTSQVTVAPVYDESGKCVQLVGAVHDITDLQIAREETKRLLKNKDNS